MKWSGLILWLAAAAGADAPPGELEAQILRAVDDRPAVGAVVSLNGNAAESNRPVRREAFVDAAGRVRFNKLPLGSYQLEVQLAGHIHDRLDRRPQQLEADNPRVSTVIRLNRKPVVTGLVTDADGRPLPRARVELYRSDYTEWGFVLRQTQSAATDDRGIYRVALEQPSRVWVKASHSEISFPFGGGERTTGVVFAPNSPDLAGAQPIPLAWDQPESQVDVALPWAPDVALAVTVRSGHTGGHCRSCRFDLLREETVGRYSIMNGRVNRPRSPDGYGITAYGIPAGDYRLIVQDQGRNGEMWLASARLALAEGPVQPYVIETAPLFPVAGRIVVEDASPEILAGLEEAGENAFQVNAQQAGDSPLGGMRNAQASVSLAEPFFELGPAPPAPFVLDVGVSTGVGYVASIERGGRKTPGRMLDLSEGGDWSDLVVRVRFDTARFEAKLSGAREEDGAYQLRLTPLDPAQSRQVTAYCDSRDGICRGSGAAPGRYHAVALPGGAINEVEFYRPSFRAALRGWAREIELRPGENPSISVRAVPPEVLEEALAAF